MIQLLRFMKSEKAIIVSMVLGIYVGITNKELSQNISSIGEIYIKLLMISVIPIVVFSLFRSILKISQSTTSLLPKLLIHCAITIFLGIIFSILISIFIKPWNYIEDIRNLNSIFSGDSSIQSFNKTIYDKFSDEPNTDLISLILSAIPSNIINSMSTGNMLQIVVGALIIGFGIIQVSKKNNSLELVNSNLNYCFEVFSYINDILISLMPIGVFFVMANQFLAINLQALITLGILTLVISGCILFQVIVYILIIWLKSNSNLSYFFKSFLETFILTFTTRSSIITLPKAMEAMIKLNYSKTLIDLYLPFGISLFRIGTMSFFAIVTLFVMGIFDIEITFTKCLFIVFACIFAAISTTGISGIIGLQMISIIFTPLGLPIGGVLAILIVVDAIVDIFETFANIMGNCAIVALVDKKSQSNNINSNF